MTVRRRSSIFLSLGGRQVADPLGERTGGVRSMSTSELIEVKADSEFEDGDRELVRVNSVEVGVLRVGGEYYAIRNQCLHNCGPLPRVPLDKNWLASSSDRENVLRTGMSKTNRSSPVRGMGGRTIFNQASSSPTTISSCRRTTLSSRTGPSTSPISNRGISQIRKFLEHPI